VLRFTRLIKTLVRSRLGVALCLLHAVLFFYTIFEKPPEAPPSELPELLAQAAGHIYFAGRYYHLHSESVLYQIVTITDLPAIFGALIPAALGLLLVKLMGINFSEYVESWIAAISVLAVASLQWLAIGYCIERWLKPGLPIGSQSND
jgi:hypothetical protein